MNRRKLLPVLLLVVLYLMVGCHKELKTPMAPERPTRQKIVSVCGGCHDTLKAVLPDDHSPVENENLPACLACHSQVSAQGGRSFDLVIHFAHSSTEGITENCWSCHRIDEDGIFSLAGIKTESGIKVEEAIVEKMDAYFRSWASSEYLDHKHVGSDTNCRSCHETDFPDSRASMDQCLSCHVSYEHVAELTREVEPNPHLSHYEDLRCTLCHKAHQAPELYCNKCHEFDLKVP